MKRSLFAILGIILSFLLCGCFHYEQKTMLNDDMSGKILIHIFPNPDALSNWLIPEKTKEEKEKQKISANIERALRDALKQTVYKLNFKEESLLKNFHSDKIKNKEFKTEVRNGATHTYFSADFDDIRELFSDKGPTVKVYEDNGMLIYEEHFGPECADELKPDQDLSKLFAGSRFVHTIQVSREIVQTNATSKGKNIATWEMPLAQALRDGVDIIVKMKK